MSRPASGLSISFDGQEHVRIHNEHQLIFAVAGCLLSAFRVAVVAACGGALGAAAAMWTDRLDGVSLTTAVLGGAACAIVLLCVVGALRPLPWRRYAARAAYCFSVFVYRFHGLLSCTVRPWQRPYEPEAGRVLLSVQTNGMGHVVQALRLIELLKERGVLVDTVCFGDLAKVPHQHVAQLRRLLPDALLLDLGHEVDHDERSSSSLLYNLAATFCLVAAPQGLRVFRKIAALCIERRFALCISLWEYHVPLYIEAARAPMGLIQVATQGMLYLDDLGRAHTQNHFQAQLMYSINLGSRGILVPLLFSRPASPQQAHGPPGGGTRAACTLLPVIMRVPPPPPSPPPDGFFVDRLFAYSATPACLASLLPRITRRKVVLFVKNVEKWKFHLRKAKNIETRPVSDEFVKLLPRCAGLVASPSPGVVLQALAAATPCYVLPATPGHLEQTFNHEHLFKHYRGLTSPATMTIEEWVDTTKPGGPALREQAEQLRGWLEHFETAADETLLPMVRDMMRPVTAASAAKPEQAPTALV